MSTKPKVDAVDGYNSHFIKTTPPAAAKFGQGAMTRQQIEEATNARREHSRALGEAGARFNGDKMADKRNTARRNRNTSWPPAY